MKNILIKIGTNCIFEKKNNLFLLRNLQNLFSNIAQLFHNNYQIWLVSSGGISSGLYYSKFESKNINKYSLFNFGWYSLIDYYNSFLLQENIISIPRLVTNLNLTENIITTEQFLKEKIPNIYHLPILNEDNFLTNSYKESGFFDNDELTYLISEKINPIYTILLSSVDGVYENFEKGNKINLLTKEHKIDYGQKNSFGTGGMESKINFCFKIEDKTKSSVFIANGLKEDTIIDIILKKKKNIGTLIKNDYDV